MWKRLTRYLILLVLAISPVFLFSPIPIVGWDLSPYSVNITITVTPMGGPTVTNGVGATSVTYNSARLNGEITATGGDNPVVTVFWGLIDGATTPASWTNNASLGAKPLGTFFYDAGSLSENKTYYYRMRAVNGAGTDWADSSANFTTPVYTVPVPTVTTTSQPVTVITLSRVKAVVKMGIGSFMILGAMVLAFWRKRIMLFILAGIISFFVAIIWIGDSLGLSIAIIGLSAYLLFRAILLVFNPDQAIEGISQFRKMSNAISGWFK